MNNISSVSAVLLVASMFFSQHAAAYDGKITISGTVKASTCKINGNDSGSGDFTVTLTKVSTRLLATSGQTAGRKPFDIVLTQCMPKTNVRAYFYSDKSVDVATGNLVLNPGGATNVEIGLLNKDLSAVGIDKAENFQNSQVVVTDDDGSATLTFYAQYVATGTATAGKAITSVLYDLDYQ